MILISFVLVPIVSNKTFLRLFLWDVVKFGDKVCFPSVSKRGRTFEGVASVPLPTIQSEKWQVHVKVREPHLNHPVPMNFPGFSL